MICFLATSLSFDLLSFDCLVVASQCMFNIIIQVIIIWNDYLHRKPSLFEMQLMIFR